MEGIIAIIAVFGTISYAIKRVYDASERKALGKGSGDPKEVKQLRDQNKLLSERVENLESIVCNVDYELNLRLAKVASEHSKLLAAGGIETPPVVEPSEVEAGATLTAMAGGHDIERRKAALKAATADSELDLGSTLGNRYRVERLLGRGGMGAVYLAHDEVLGELIALKVITSAWSHDQRGLIDRLRREASAARKVSSPNVIRIHDLGETKDGLMYISMEYFPGKTLGDILDTRGTLTPKLTQEIIGQICNGLEAAHDAGVVHRDLKPQNVLVAERNAVKLIDFGLAKTAFMSGMTATGLILGTPYYMSPEQVRGKDVDARSDIYSLGALTYHAVTGEPPFQAETPIAVGFAHCSETARPPKTLRGSLSDQLNDVIMAALSKDPRDRPQSAAEFRDAL